MASAGASGAQITSDRYYELVERGLIEPDDRVELLEGVIVSMAPQDPIHAYTISTLQEALGRAFGERAVVRTQLPLLLSPTSMPEPDVAVVAGRPVDYLSRHPTTALLVVEVAASSLAQDRLTKAPIYAAAGVPEYWIVNLREGCVEVRRAPVAAERRYAETSRAERGERLTLVAFPDVTVPVDAILPPP